MTTIFLIIATIALIVFLYIHFLDSREITKEEYNNKYTENNQRKFNSFKKKINRRLNRLYSKFRLESKHNFDEMAIEEYLISLNFKNFKLSKGYGADYYSYEFEIND